MYCNYSQVWGQFRFYFIKLWLLGSNNAWYKIHLLKHYHCDHRQCNILELLSWSLLQRQKPIIIYYVKKFVNQRISVMKTNTGVFVVFKTKSELKCQSSGNIRVCLFLLLRFFDELFDVINDDPFVML